jgi:uncharacterized protein YjiS (DUF1127 family)
MSAVFDNSHALPTSEAKASAFYSIASVFRVLARRLANRAAIRQLAEADECMLHDIGLTRSAVDAALRAPPFADPMAHSKDFSAGQRLPPSSR